MLNLLQNHDTSEILLWVVILGLALKELVGYFDWGKAKTDAHDNKVVNIHEKEKELDRLKERVEKQEESLAEIRRSLDANNSVNLVQLRFSIIQLCDEALKNKDETFPKSKMDNLIDLYKIYRDTFKGNTYAHEAYEDVMRVYNFNGTRKK